MAEELLKISGLPEEIWETIVKETQRITVYVERRRWGKKVTVIEGLDKSINGKKLARELKKKLACGGTFKDGRIELQGDHRAKIKKILVEMGFSEESIEIK